MKLTPHQKQIIDAINAEQVYDIPSYLKYFKKSTSQQYDIKEIQKTFNEYENGKKYSYSQLEDGSFNTNVYDRNGNLLSSFSSSHKNMNAYFIEYPLEEPVSAQLDNVLSNEVFEFKGEKYSFNFLSYSYDVADRFDDIKDFIALWYYLKNEALIFEVEKQVKDDELSLFFEKNEQKIFPVANPDWNTKTVIADGFAEQNNIPYKRIKNYMSYLWKLNKEHVVMCQDFIGKKIIPTSGLKVYADHKYRTFEERSQRNNIIVAWVAVFISISTIFINNNPFSKDTFEREQIQTISTKTTSIENELSNMNDTLEYIQNELDDINTTIEKADKSSGQSTNNN